MTETLQPTAQEQLYELSLRLEQFKRDMVELAKLIKEMPKDFNPDTFEYDADWNR